MGTEPEKFGLSLRYGDEHTEYRAPPLFPQWNQCGQCRLFLTPLIPTNGLTQ